MSVRDGSFEKEWGHRHVWVCETGSEPRKMPTANCFVPPDWEFWWEHGPDLHLPEVTDAWKEHDPRRVVTGKKAIQYFKSFDQYHAGFYQQVNVAGMTITIFLASRELWGFRNNNSYWDTVSLDYDEATGVIVLRAHCQAWSNHRDKIPGHEECRGDPRCSYGVGVADYTGLLSKAPPLNGDPWNDAIGNIAFRIGIDTTSGTNPLATTVEWSAWRLSYNYHHMLINQSTIYGKPTVPYEVLVRTPAQNQESYRNVCEIAAEGLNSVVPSHDDTGRLCNVVCPSGAGGLAVLYDIPPGEHQAYLDFYAERYPLARIEFAYSGEPPSQWEEFLLSQCDPAWASHVYAEGQCHTLCSQGCWITCCAMAQRLLGIKADATPVTVDRALGAGGYAGCLMLHSAMPQLGLEVVGSTTSPEKAADFLGTHLDSLLFIEVEPDTLMHFVVGVEYDGDDFIVLDPWKNRVAPLKELYAGAESFRLVGRHYETPAGGVELVGLHLQHMEPGWDTFYRKTNSYGAAPIAKVFSPEDVLGILRQNPETNVIVRPYVPNQQPFLYPENEDFANAAKIWVDNMRDTLYRVCDQIAAEFPGRKSPYFVYESANEEYENVNDDKNRRAAAFDTAVAVEIYNTRYPFVAGICCAAIGNPDATQFHHLVSMAERFRVWPTFQQPWWGYHGYFLRNLQYGGPNHLWPYLAGRFEEIQRVLPYQVPWYFGESGAIGGKSSPPETMALVVTETRPAHWIQLQGTLNTGTMTTQDNGWVAMYPDDGWRHPGVYNGDWMAHQGDLEVLQARCVDAVDNFKGLVVFTSCAHFMGWEHFRVKSPQMEALQT